MYTDTIKIEKGNWTTIYNDIFRSEINGVKLTPEAWGLYVFMQSLPENWDFSIIGLTKVVNAGKNKIQRILKELEVSGFLKREQREKTGQFGRIEYKLFNRPYTDNRETVKTRDNSPYPQKPYPQKPHTGFEPQLSTNKQNTNKQILKESSNKLNNGNKSENGKAQVNNSISLSLVKKVGDDLKINENIYNKFFNYYKSRNFKTADNIIIDSRNLKNLLILWNDREKDFNKNTLINKEVTKPAWIDEYVDELKELE